MAHRTFIDSSGTEWQVWETIPTRGSVLAPDVREGWLTFESVSGKHRLAPVVEGWAVMPSEKLDLLCRIARSASGPHPRWSSADAETEAPRAEARLADGPTGDSTARDSQPSTSPRAESPIESSPRAERRLER